MEARVDDARRLAVPVSLGTIEFTYRRLSDLFSLTEFSSLMCVAQIKEQERTHRSDSRSIVSPVCLQNPGRFMDLHEDSCRQADSVQLLVWQSETAKRRALSHV